MLYFFVLSVQADGNGGSAADAGGGAAASGGGVEAESTSASEASTQREVASWQQPERVLPAGAAEHTQVRLLCLPSAQKRAVWCTNIRW